MSDARVRIDIEEREDTRNGIPGFFLIARASEPEDFPDYLAAQYPDYPFVYLLQDINFVQDAAFVRVASIADLRESGITFSKSGDQYRTNTYTKFFGTVEELLAAEEILIRDLRTLYSDIKTLFTYIQTSKTRSSYILPDYVEDTVNTLIKNLIAKRQGITSALTKHSLVLQMIDYLTVNLQAIQIQNEDINKYLAETDIDCNKLSGAELSKFTASLQNLLDTTTQWNTFYDSTFSRFWRLGTTTANYRGILTDPELPGFFPDDSTYMTQFLGIATQLSAVLDEANKDQVITMSVNAETLRVLVQNCKAYLKVGIDKILTVDKLEKVQDAINQNASNFNRELERLTAEKNSLSAQVEQLKGEIQDIEVQLKKLVPTIDLNKPENFWAVNVNINTTA